MVRILLPPEVSQEQTEAPASQRRRSKVEGWPKVCTPTSCLVDRLHRPDDLEFRGGIAGAVSFFGFSATITSVVTKDPPPRQRSANSIIVTGLCESLETVWPAAKALAHQLHKASPMTSSREEARPRY